jgi:predicted dehydrogenase
MKKIKGDSVVWGIIGAGDVCEKKSAPAMNKIPGSHIKAVMRRDAEKAEDYARRHSVPYWFNTAEPILNDSEINAIYIATPPGSHAEYVRLAAKAHKAVYVEKPMARNHPECLQMIEDCKIAGVPLYVAYYRRALPNFLKIKETIDLGIIGEIRAVNIEMYKPNNPEFQTRKDLQWRVNPEISGGGLFHDLASHQFDFLDFILGPITQASGYGANQGKQYNADDTVSASFTFENGVLGSGIWCFATSSLAEKDKTTITGTKGVIEYPTFGNTVIIDSESTGKKEFSFQMPEHIQQPFIHLVIEDLFGREVCPGNGKTAARTSWVMDEICK